MRVPPCFVFCVALARAVAAEDLGSPVTSLNSTALIGRTDTTTLVQWAGAGQPPNDSFASRTRLSGTNLAVIASLARATSEAGEPTIVGVSSGQTAWWSWTSPSNGVVTLATAGTNFNPLVAVYAGNELQTLSLVASNSFLSCYEHAACGCHWLVRDQVSFHASSGQTYQIAIDSALATTVSWADGWLPQSLTAFNTNFWFYPGGMRLGRDGDMLVHVAWPVWTTNVLAGGPVRLGLKFTAAPSNDDFERPTVVRGVRPQFKASNAGASRQTGEPDHAGNIGGSSVWYSYTAPFSGRLTLSINEIPPYSPPTWDAIYGSGSFDYTPTLAPACGDEHDLHPLPAFFPVFAAYTGASLGSLSTVSQPLSLPDHPYAITLDVIQGHNYRVAFDGNAGTFGDVTLYLALTRPASNDNFENRVRVHGINVLASSHNAGASRQQAEPTPPSGSLGKTVWWSWKAPVSGQTLVDLAGSDFSFPASVYEGLHLATLHLVAAGTTNFFFEAIAGHTYQIAVSDAAGLTGAITLHLRAPTAEAVLTKSSRRTPSLALLTYQALPGQVMLLQRSLNGGPWANVITAMARDKTISFLATPAPSTNGFAYRAVVVDYY